MFMLGPIGFLTPWLLVALLALPILWFLLRAVPPAPLKRRFPGVALMLGLNDEEVETDRTPWWLLLLRILAIAALIVAFSGPVLNPQIEAKGRGPLLILLDASWASAPVWPSHRAYIDDVLEKAATDNRPTAIVAATNLPADTLTFLAPTDLALRLPGLEPAPFAPDMPAVAKYFAGQNVQVETIWLSDGLTHVGRDTVLAQLEKMGRVSVVETPRSLAAIGPVTVDELGVSVPVLRLSNDEDETYRLNAHGPDPSGVARVLAAQDVTFRKGETASVVQFDLPPEIRNRITRLEVEGQQHAGAKRLADDSLKRREVGLVTTQENREGLELLSQLHYIRAALFGKSDVVEGSLSDIILANPDVIVLADIAQLSGGEVAALLDWMSEGGMLLRFAGPRLAASNVSRDDEDPLMPVRLRAGGRTIGGAMSWGEPKALRAFSEQSPFYGLDVPNDVAVSAQVLAQPDPDLASRVIATLADGTPLVTRKAVGQGQVVLFHVTASAQWSTLPLSGVFVSMLERLAVTTRSAALEAHDFEGQNLQPLRVMDGYGALSDGSTLAPVAGESFATDRLSGALLPGLYQGRDVVAARNVIGADDGLAPVIWPADTVILGADRNAESRLLLPHFLVAALALLAADILAALALSGRLFGPRAAMMALALSLVWQPHQTKAQSVDGAGDAFALAASQEIALAYVVTGDGDVDALSRAGLFGLSRTLTERTSVEPNAPIGVDLARDDLGFFPFLYWPIVADQPLPSAEAYIKLNTYLRTGGTIMFDTRDADIAGFGAATPNGLRLQELARALDIPPLEQIPSDHVLTRAFYLLQDFPGRHQGGELWVEASPPNTAEAEGMPFRNLNDNVTPVIIGGGDWSAAWAMEPSGRPMRPVGRGFSGDTQREIAYRFGVNVVMYILTGNYKSDQVHVPALLERLGQ